MACDCVMIAVLLCDIVSSCIYSKLKMCYFKQSINMIFYYLFIFISLFFILLYNTVLALPYTHMNILLFKMTISFHVETCPV